jgi:hypothetical protein
MVNIFYDRHSDAMSLKQCFGNSFRRVKVANSVWQLNNYNSIGAVSNNGTESERCFHLHVYTLNDKKSVMCNGDAVRCKIRFTIVVRRHNVFLLQYNGVYEDDGMWAALASALNTANGRAPANRGSNPNYAG